MVGTEEAKIYDAEVGAHYMSVKDAAEYLGYDEFSIRNLISKGVLKPYRKIGNKCMFLKEQLDRFRATNPWAQRKAELKETGVKAPPSSPDQLKAVVRMDVVPGAVVGLVDESIDFSWNQLPLIRAKIHNVHGDIPFSVEVSGPDGGVWQIGYQPPTWIEKLWKKMVGK